MNLAYKILRNDYKLISGTKVYRIYYTKEETFGGYICDDTEIDNCYISETSHIVNSKLVDTFVEDSIISNSIISDSNIADSHLTYVHLSECDIRFDLSLCTLYGEEIIDMEPILAQ